MLAFPGSSLRIILILFPCSVHKPDQMSVNINTYIYYSACNSALCLHLVCRSQSLKPQLYSLAAMDN